MSASATKKQPLHIKWFRQNLRLHDNPALNRAIQNVNMSPKNDISNGIVPIYCFDPRFVGSSNNNKCGVRRAKFLLDSVQDLRSNLEKNGSGLVVAYGKTEEVLKSLYDTIDKEIQDSIEPNVVVQYEPASEEIQVDNAVNRISNSLETVDAATLYDIDDIPFSNGVKGLPNTFTPFRTKMEKLCKIPSPTPVPRASSLALPDNQVLASILSNSENKCSLSYMPTLLDLGYSQEEIDAAIENPDSRGVMVFKGGESAGLERIQEYIFDKDRLKIYFDTRNGMLGADYSTKFSPWLAHGCISPRYVAKECSRYEKVTGIVNKSTYWVVFELLWGNYFRFFAQKHGDAIFGINGIGNHGNVQDKWNSNKKALQAWKDGMTGYPLVDANMRELKATGFMSNRGRQNVASFLALDMKHDWRDGAAHFETELLDYDVYANWGNWCAAAGQTGGRVNRFNIVKQSKDYDAQGEYVRTWCPELTNIPTKFIHDPWKLTQEQQKEYGVILGVDYPNPIIKPFVPKYNNNKGGGRNQQQNNKKKGGKQQRRGSGNNNPNRGRNQRQDMKSLKQGSYDFQ